MVTGLAFKPVCVPQKRSVTRANKPVSNGTIRTSAMLVWNPFEMKKYETFSYLPALNDQEIARQVDYITRNGWVPCLEFADVADAYVNSENCVRMGSVTANYFDNRYWTMWKLPMFGCTDPGQVITEVANCRKAFPGAYSRLVAFDPIRQVQIASFVVNHPELKGKKGSYGEEVSNGFSGSAGSSSSSYSSSAATWDTSSAKTNDWTYTWDKSDSSSNSWDSGAKKDDWSYDWSKSSEPASTSSWDTGKKDDWSYDWNKDSSSSSSWDTKKDDWSSSSSWNSGSSSSYNGSSSYGAGEDAELKRTMEDVQRKLDQLKSTISDVVNKVDTPASSGSYSSSWSREEAVSSLERSYGTSGTSSWETETKKDNAWNSW